MVWHGLAWWAGWAGCCGYPMDLFIFWFLTFPLGYFCFGFGGAEIGENTCIGNG